MTCPAACAWSKTSPIAPTIKVAGGKAQRRSFLALKPRLEQDELTVADYQIIQHLLIGVTLCEPLADQQHADPAQAALRTRRSTDFGKPCSAIPATIPGSLLQSSILQHFVRAAPPMHYLMRQRQHQSDHCEADACSTPPVVRPVLLPASERRPATFDLTRKAHRRAS